MKCYVINLKDKKERWAHVVAACRPFGLEVVRVEAVNGKEVAGDADMPFSPQMLRRLWPGELGCLLSHKKIWKMIAAGTDECVLVLEDDAVFGADFKAFIEDVESKAEQFDFIHLEATGKGEEFLAKGEPIVIGNTKVSRLLGPAFGSAALILTKTCAKRLLELSENLYMPLDEVLLNKYSPVYGKLRVYQVHKPVVWQIDDILRDVPEGLASSVQEKKKNVKSKSLLLHLRKVAKKLSYFAYLTAQKDKVRVRQDLSEKNTLSI
jgi:glycosyl transferase family 25